MSKLIENEKFYENMNELNEMEKKLFQSFKQLETLNIG